MATRAEQIRRHQMAQEARERIKSGLYKQTQNTSINPRTEALSRYSPYVEDKPMSELQKSFGSVTPQNLISSAVQTGVQQRKSKPLTQYEINKQEIDKLSPYNPVKYYSGLMNELTQGNPVGQFISRIGSTPDAIASGGKPASVRPDLGPTANKAADFLGSLLSVAVPSGAPIGSGPLAAPYTAIDDIVSASPKVAKAETAISKAISNKVISPQTAQKITREGLREGAAGAIQGPAITLMQGQPTNRELAENAGLGVLAGAGIGAAVPLVGAGLKGARSSLSALNEGNTSLGITGIKSKIKPYDNLRTDTKSQLTSRSVRKPISGGKITDKLYTQLVDDLHPLNKLDKLTESVLGKEIPASESPYKLALGSRGADVVSKQIITDKLVDSAGNVAGKSLKDVLSQLPRTADSYVNFEDYLINKHAITRAERGEKVFRDELNWTPEVGAQKVADYEAAHPEFKTMADDLYEFNRNMVNKWLVDTGMITPEQANAWFEANPYYVPNKREFSELEKSSGGKTRAKSGYGNQSVPVKGYSKGGSQRNIISPIESMIENVDAFVKTAKRNQVMQKLVQNIEQDPDAFADFADIIKQPEKLDDITKVLMDGEGIDDLLSRFSDDFDKAMMKTKLDKDNIVRVMVNGEPVHVKVNDPDLLKALTTLGPDNGSALLNFIGKFTNTFKVLTTGSNPLFSFTRNLFRDIPQAYIASKSTGNPVSFMADLVTAAIDIAGKRGAYREFLNVGGGHSSPIASNRNMLARSKDAVLPPNKNPFKGMGPKMYRKFEDFMNVAETAPRLAEFKRTSKQSGDLQKALYEAQDVTTNFKRRGRLVNELDKIFPYMNAAVQGLDQVVRVYKDNPGKALLKSALALSVPSMVLYAVNYDDPNYQKLSRRTRDAFFMIPKGDGTFIRIAKPQEQGTIFSDIPERLMELFFEQDPDAFRDFADRLRTTFLPPGIQGAAKSGNIVDRALGVVGDTIAGPLADVAANRNFADAPIVPGYLERLSPELQYDSRTTNVARKIGELTGTSPKQLDYLARQYSGFLGQIGQPLLSPGGDLGSSLTQQVTADPVFSNDISTEFYDYKEKLDQAYTDRSLKPLPSWYKDGVRKRLGTISDNMSAVRAQIRKVQSDQSLNNKDKREKLRDLQEKINTMADKGNEIAREANIPR